MPKNLISLIRPLNPSRFNSACAVEEDESLAASVEFVVDLEFIIQLSEQGNILDDS
jgi:hypothetical protein